jgi:hypothetical protein
MIPRCGASESGRRHQLVTPQSVYFNYSVLKNDMGGNLNAFFPQVGPTWERFLKLLPLLGIRYYVVGDHLSPSCPEIEKLSSNSGVHNCLKLLADRAGFPVEVLPQGAHHNLGPTARWHIYEIPHPNLGDYSPTIPITAETGAAAAAIMIQPNFDFTRQVVLSTETDKSLVPAHNMQMSLYRGGLHVSGHTDGTSLVVLPQQFSHCLRARDPSVRLVRANLMMTGMIFPEKSILTSYSTTGSSLLGVAGRTSRISRSLRCKSMHVPFHYPVKACFQIWMRR